MNLMHWFSNYHQQWEWIYLHLLFTLLPPLLTHLGRWAASIKREILRHWRKIRTWNYQLVTATCRHYFLFPWHLRVHSGHGRVIPSAPEFDQDGGTMRGSINVIYSSHHGCYVNPTSNTRTSVNAVWIPIACPLMRISVCAHAVHMWEHTETINSLLLSHTHKMLLSESSTVLPMPSSLWNTLHLTPWVKSIALKYELDSFALK